MRILHTISGGDWGGIEHRVLIQSRWLLNNGHDVLIAAPKNSRVWDGAVRDGIDVVPISFFRPYWPHTILRLRRIVKEFRPDILDSHGGRDSLSAIFCRDLCRVVHTRHLVHALTPDVFKRLRWKFGYDYVVSTSQTGFGNLLGNGLVSEDKCSVVGEWAEPEFFAAYGADPSSIRRELDIPQDAFVVGVIGMLRPDKGQDDFVKALARIDPRQREKIVALVVGAPTSKTHAFGDYVKSLAGANNADRKIRFLGHRDDVAHILSAVDLIVVPSRAEAQSRVVPQAFAAGRPAIATNTGGLPELVYPGATGWLVPVGDVGAIARILSQAMEDPALVRAMGERAHRFAAEYLQLEDRMRETMAAYRVATK